MEVFKIRTIALIILSYLIFLLFGCAVKTAPEWKRFQEMAKERTDQELLWEKSEEEHKAILTEVDELLADGLSRQEAGFPTLHALHRIAKSLDFSEKGRDPLCLTGEALLQSWNQIGERLRDHNVQGWRQQPEM